MILIHDLRAHGIIMVSRLAVCGQVMSSGTRNDSLMELLYVFQALLVSFDEVFNDYLCAIFTVWLISASLCVCVIVSVCVIFCVSLCVYCSMCVSLCVLFTMCITVCVIHYFNHCVCY